MRRRWFTGGRRLWLIALGSLLAAPGPGWAGNGESDLRALIEEQRRLLEQQGRQIEELRRQVEALRTAPPPPAEGTQKPAAEEKGKEAQKPKTDEEAVKKIIGTYLQDNPGAGMPPGVQTGFETGKGFVIRSAPNPSYVKWADDCRIPFELRVKGRIQLDYYNYKSTDATNHMTNRPATQNTNSVRFPDFSALEIKRGNMILEGNVFSPDLRYRINFNGFTRGIPGYANNEVVQTAPPGGITPSTAPVSPIGGGITTDHAVNLFECWIAYDFRGCAAEKGCGCDCPEGQVPYAPTWTLIGGKFKPFFGLDEILGNQTMQFVEFSMASLFFSADDDARMMGAGLQLKHLEDRLFLQAILTNGSDGSFIPSSHNDQYPGFLAGAWYDLGGSWNEEKKAWDLFGDGIADVDHSCRPVVRVGGCVNLVPMDRRSLYGDAEQGRYFTMPAAPGGSRLINVLNGDAGTPPGSRAVDQFDAYTYNAFAALKYRGLSVCGEAWLRNLNNFRTTPNGQGVIVYQDTLGPGGAPRNALFPSDNGLIDYGTELSVGYFLIPTKLEVAARWSWVRGQSGDVNGDGTFTAVTVPGVPGTVHVVDGAFRNFHDAHEYTVGVNYYFRRHLLKWQTDLSIYDGGNPAGGGASVAGFIPGIDGYLVRTQVQLAF